MSNGLNNGVVYSIRAACAALVIVWPAVAGAQVGHPPSSSPYKDVRGKWFLSATGGYTWGGGGTAGVGPHDGPMGGLRLDLLLGGPADIGITAQVGNLTRLLVDPEATELDQRYLGEAKQSILFLEGSFSLVFTGRKTWNGFAPFIGGALGLAFGGSVPEDSLSSFEFNTKFTVGLYAGTRWHLGDRIVFRFEVRDVLWQLKYPPEFFIPPEEGVPPLLNPLVNKDSEWTHNPQITLALGYAIRM